ncbi:MAG TPA: DUF1513 domain-containing protein [Sulfurivirga caldicuralii]|nr:DUF1513 domain-containing protein [Sulfurivirga caldicuralii]
MSMFSRRQFIGSLLAMGMPIEVIANMALPDTRSAEREILVSAMGDKKTGYGFGFMSVAQQALAKLTTDFRGHGVSQHPLNPSQVIMYGRRPGNMAIVADVLQNKIVNRFRVAKNRFFYGHGCFSHDGKTLFTTEGDSITGEGKIGIRDSVTYQQLGEFDAGGIGPHDLTIMPDGKTLVVAIGGILTRPETGRKKLNLHEMVSTLTYIDTFTGKKIDEFRVPESKSSIRHLDIASDGTVAIAMQIQRSAMTHDNPIPLGAIHKPNEDIKLLTEPVPLIRAMNDYLGSVVINEQTRIAGFTSPRGNIVGFWNIDTLEFVGYHQMHDVCGIAVNSKHHFMISNSLGEVRELDGTTLKEYKQRRVVHKHSPWDNHMLAITV